MSAISSALQSRPSSVSTAQTTAIGGNPVLRSRASDSSAIPDRAVMPPGRSTKGMTWPGVVIAPGQTGSCTAARIVTARSRADIPVETPSQASNEIPTSTSSRGPLRRGSTLRPRAAKRSSCIASETIPRAVPAIWLIIPGETNAAGAINQTLPLLSSMATVSASRSWRMHPATPRLGKPRCEERRALSTTASRHERLKMAFGNKSLGGNGHGHVCPGRSRANSRDQE